MLDQLRVKRDAIRALARKHKAEKLWVFGSCARKEERQDSDVDFVVKFLPSTSLLTHASLESDLAQLIGRSVDVVSYGAIDENSLFGQQVLAERIAI